MVGTEATGLSEEWMAAADEKIKIPMLGKIDSLNVSVSAGIILLMHQAHKIIAPGALKKIFILCYNFQKNF